MRITVLVFSAAVLAYAIRMQGTPIYDLVSGAYQVHAGGRLRAAGVRPVLEARHARRARSLSVVLGIGVWLLFLAMPWGEDFPAQLAGVLAAFAGMVAGSLAPQWLPNARTAAPPAGRRRGLSARACAGGAALIIEGFASGRPAAHFAPHPMPIYAYKCSACGHAKDVLQKMSDAPLTDVPGLRRRARSASS